MKKITNLDIQIIANNAVREAQKKSLNNGIANVYSKNGIVYFQLPNGSITMQSPFENNTQVQQNLEANKTRFAII